MGMEIYIYARVVRKSDKKTVTIGCLEEEWAHCSELEREYFGVCWWRKDYEMLEFLMKTASQYGIEIDDTKTHGTFPLPMEAMREIYAGIVKRSCYDIPEDEPDDIRIERVWAEYQNIKNAHALYCILSAIETKSYGLWEDVLEWHLCEEAELEEFKQPDNFQWEFLVSWG